MISRRRGPPKGGEASSFTARCLVHNGGYLDDEAIIRSASQLAARIGADVHVIAETSVPNGLENWVDGIARGCPSWQTNGVDRPNLFVVAVSFEDRQTTMRFGTDFAPALDSIWEQISNDKMNGRFRDAVNAVSDTGATPDLTEGFTAGLAAVGSAVAGGENPVSQPTTPTAAPTQSDETASPGGVSIPWKGVLIFFSALAALGALVYAGAMVVTARVRAREARETFEAAWRERLQPLIAEIDTAIGNLSTRLASLRDVPASSATDEQAADWTIQISDISGAHERANALFADARPAAGDIETYEKAGRTLDHVHDIVRDAVRTLDRIESEMTAAEQDFASFAAKAEAATATIAAAEAAITAASSRYVTGTLTERLAAATQLLNEGRSFHTARDGSNAVISAEQAASGAAEIRDDAVSFLALAKRTGQLITKVAAEIEEATTNLNAADQADDQLALRWTRSAWSEHAGTYDKATKMLVEARRRHASATDRLAASPSDPIGAMADADKALDLANGVDREAEGVVDLAEKLDTIARSLPGEIDEARSAIESGVDYAQGHDEVAGALNAAIRKAREALAEAVQASPTDDPTEVLSDATSAWNLATGALESARREVARLAQVEREIARELAEAKSDLDDVGRQVRSASWGRRPMSNLEASLARALAISDLDRRLAAIRDVARDAEDLERRIRADAEEASRRQRLGRPPTRLPSRHRPRRRMAVRRRSGPSGRSEAAAAAGPVITAARRNGEPRRQMAVVGTLHVMSALTMQLFFATLAVVALAGSVTLIVARAAGGRIRALDDFVEAVRPSAAWLAWLVAATCMAGSLYFSEVVHLRPCRLCWYQRAAMYPLVAAIAIYAITGNAWVRRYVRVAALIGLTISSWHYLVEWVPSLEPSNVCEIANPCTTVWFRRMGFVTIPFMALCGFTAITVLMSMRPDVPAGETAADAEDPELVSAH